MGVFERLRGIASAGAGAHPRRRRVTIDFETRSVASVRNVGAARYSEDPTTQALCLRYKFHGEDGVGLWHRAHPSCGIDESPPPLDLFEAIADGCLVEAHNAFFERMIWRNVMQVQHGWPPVPDSSWRCSAAKAASHALPRALEHVARVLGTRNQKDMEGAKAMKRLTEPRKLGKKERTELRQRGVDPDGVLAWHEDPDDIRRNWDYCAQDVLTEEEVSDLLRDLPEKELRVWQLDQRLNERGVACDTAGVAAALRIVGMVQERMVARFRELTDCPDFPGGIDKPSSRVQVKEWCKLNGVPLPDTTAATLDKTVAKAGVPPHVRAVLSIVRSYNRTSTKKYVAMLDRVCRDGRIRDLLMYWGSHTGRWSGKGIQVQNFPRGSIKDMSLAWSVVRAGDPELCELLYGDVMEFLSHATRGALVAPPGKELAVADFAAIEARVVLWLANPAYLDVFHRGEDIYCDMAKAIYGHEVNKSDHPDERFTGKQAILGLGFGMGPPKFRDTCLKHGVLFELPFCRHVVRTYRSRYPDVRALWRQIEEGAISAVRTGQTVETGRVSWRVVGRFLHCRLPSGRLLSYFDPRIRRDAAYFFTAVDPSGEGDKLMVSVPIGALQDRRARIEAVRRAESEGVRLTGEFEWSERPTLTYMSVNQKTRKWEREDTYGGKLTENVVQAIARDLMAEAMLRADEDGRFEIVMSVHDELVSETDAPVDDQQRRSLVQEFEALMAEVPDWAEGCPVAAEGWIGKRYKK